MAALRTPPPPRPLWELRAEGLTFLPTSATCPGAASAPSCPQLPARSAGQTRGSAVSFLPHQVPTHLAGLPRACCWARRPQTGRSFPGGEETRAGWALGREVLAPQGPDPKGLSLRPGDAKGRRWAGGEGRRQRWEPLAGTVLTQGEVQWQEGAREGADRDGWSMWLMLQAGGAERGCSHLRKGRRWLSF